MVKSLKEKLTDEFRQFPSPIGELIMLCSGGERMRISFLMYPI